LTAGDDRAVIGHCARRVERALSAECARSLASRTETTPALQFHVRDEAEDADDEVVSLYWLELARGEASESTTASWALLRF